MICICVYISVYIYIYIASSSELPYDFLPEEIRDKYSKCGKIDEAVLWGLGLEAECRGLGFGGLGFCGLGFRWLRVYGCMVVWV